MIEKSRSDLEREGFSEFPGFWEGVLYNPRLYMIYEVKSPSITIVMKELEPGVYFPHRAKDTNNTQYGEQYLLSELPTADFTEISQLILFLESPHMVKILQSSSNKKESFKKEEKVKKP